jgi:MoaD family protein
MKITLRYTSQLATVAGTSEETVEVSDGTLLVELLGNLAERYGPEFSKFALNDEGNPVTTLVVAVNGTQVDLGEDISLETGAEVILITPMSGG